MRKHVIVAAAVGLVPCLTVAATTVHHAHPPTSGGPALVDERLSQQQLRHKIEEGVLSGLASGMREHGERVERGELRPRPFVTLTYAQSIDGSIAAADKSQVFLSGSESRTMTHGLRSIHDGILVGAGTVRQDNPRLNIRHWPPASCGDGVRGTTSSEEEEEEDAFDQARGSDAIGRGGKETAAPRAVVLAGNLSQLPRSMRLGGAVVFTDLSSPDAWRWLSEWAQRSREGSEDRAANDFVIVHSPLQADGRCDVGDCLEKLYSMGFRSLMVEGGATVISSFLRGCGEEMARDEECGRNPDGQLVDRVVVTIAPMFLQGYNVLATEGNACGARTTSPGSGFPLPLLDVGFVRLGQDLVVVGAPACCQGAG
ncbi:unnamed protein product [Ectocarpus sp. 8 AP-2014]